MDIGSAAPHAAQRPCQRELSRCDLGARRDHTFPENEAYDPNTDRWTSLAPMPHGRHGFGGDVIGDDAFFVGGSLSPGDKGATDQLLMFHLP